MLVAGCFHFQAGEDVTKGRMQVFSDTNDLSLSRARTPDFDGTEDTDWSKPSLDEYKSGLDLPDDAQWDDLTADQRQRIVAHTLIGEASADTFSDANAFPVVNPLTGNLNGNALRNAASRAFQADISSDTAESIQLVANRLLDEYFRDENSEASSHILYVDLSDLIPGKPFDGLMAGNFVDMRGREVEIDAEDLPEYVANTRDLIRKNVEGRGLDGLPIDAKLHDKGDAAGWIVDVLLEDDVLRIIPKWTDLGVEKIRKGIQRLFSATIDTANKVILGGTLTNWPAIKGLRAIELSSGTYILQEESLDDKDDRGGIQQEYAEPRREEIKNERILKMEITEEQFKERVDALVSTRLNELIAERMGLEDGRQFEETDIDPLDLFDLSDQVENIEVALTERQLELYNQLEERAEKQALRKLQRIRHEQNVADLAHDLTAGTDEAPRAFRQDTETLEEMLLALPRDQYQKWADLLTATQKNGLAEFEELGHAKKVTGTKKLPDYYADQLRTGELKLSDLRNPLIADEVGDLAQYDLSEFEQ